MKILFFVLMIVSLSCGFEIKWKFSPELYPDLIKFRECGKLTVYKKQTSFNVFSAQDVYFFFYFKKLYKINLRYDSLYRFLEDREKLTGRKKYSAVDIERYDYNETVVVLKHTPFINKD